MARRRMNQRDLFTEPAAEPAATARDHYDQEASKRMKSGKKADPVENLPQGNDRARDAVGKAVGVSGKSVDFAKHHKNPFAIALASRCLRCGGTAYHDYELIAGRGVRRDCANPRCRWTFGFPVWRGRKIEASHD